MTDRPIIFSAPMVRALLDGRKTQTRRIYRVPPGSYVEQGRIWAMTDGCPHGDAALPYAPGDRLWVREAFTEVPMIGPRYYATNDIPASFKKVSPIHMPRWASRLTLTVTEVRVQRLQEISEEDARSEGFGSLITTVDKLGPSITARDGFREIWHTLHGPGAWDANPWVAALTFTVHRQNIDQMEPTK